LAGTYPDAFSCVSHGYRAECRHADYCAPAHTVCDSGSAWIERYSDDGRLDQFGVTIIAALAAWSARETYRIPMNRLGEPDAVPIDKADYDLLRGELVADDKLSRGSA
jgi:hypothetical protein